MIIHGNAHLLEARSMHQNNASASIECTGLTPSSYINVLFWDGPHNFERRSDCEDDFWAGVPLSKLPHHDSAGDVWPLRMDEQAMAPYTVDLQCNRVSNLELSGP
ncbi:hypothetical protein AVEN_25319-1 [Araneus ventricosus]|uniref:Uncharacterized protein n=1 Tax=Araneus ventricosus TaxID=182803 RepID=A0A4Y2ITJ3_ARAVE|nr:hypothetical protein AVEN_25319-1 [Araneus ventricosus]